MRIRLFSMIVVLATTLLAADGLAGPNIFATKHNLSVSGPGDIKALSETRVCVFCHTPHNATPLTPLWNRELKPVNYTTYSSSTMGATIPQPTGPTRLCLSCHDGTVALGKVLSVPGGIAMTMEIPQYRSTFIGTNLANDHPVSFSYQDSLPNEELAPSFPQDLLRYANDFIHCTTCHDPHDDTYGKFLVVDNRYSGLCVRCHRMKGWTLASHRTATATWNNSGMDPWPHTPWTTVAENGCENCHAPHNAGGPERLLNFLREEDNCYTCHAGTVAATNILAEISKQSSHPVTTATAGQNGAHDPTESPVGVSGHVECVDCHNPHAAFASSNTQAPQVPGPLTLVSGEDQFGGPVPVANFEYEICFKCHAESNAATPVVTRYIDESDIRREFDPLNPSFHPVVAPGRNLDMPSLPSVDEPTLDTTSRIYCSDCHDADDSPAVGGSGARGPHGSIYAPILRQRYETADGSVETYDAYALCYRCHDRNAILADTSFQQRGGSGGHSGHLTGHGTGSGTSCATCHDPHGVVDDGASGSHTHLINFNQAVVQPAAGQSVPMFIDTGSRSGYCLLVCHGFAHDNTNSSYP